MSFFNTGRSFNPVRADDLIGRHIAAGRFTPFIGAGASALAPESIELDEWPWNRISQTLRAISWNVEHRSYPDSQSEFSNFDGLEAATERSRQYLNSAIGARVSAGNNAELIHAIIYQSEKVEEAARDKTRVGAKTVAYTDRDVRDAMLTRFQAQLTRAAAALSIAFGERFMNTIPSVKSPESCAVVFGSGDPACATARIELYRAVELAGAMAARREAAESPFAREGGTPVEVHSVPIYRKLLALAVSLSREKDKAYLALQRVANMRELAEEYRQVPDPSFLELTTLRWLDDLLWHTIRYWIGHHPTAPELAFELALMTEGPTKSPELAQAAQLRESSDSGALLQRQIRSIFARCGAAQLPSEENSGSSMQEFPGRFKKAQAEFCHAIAASLVYQHELFQTSRHDDAQSGLRPSLAFTTNYDRSLERVFEHYGVTFHEFFPLRETDPDSHALAWWCRTVKDQEDWRSIWPEGPQMWDPDRFQFSDGSIVGEVDEGARQLRLEGPVILKLHGSPLVPAPQDWEHALVLSEEDYLREIGLPIHFEGELDIPDYEQHKKRMGTQPPPRATWFLGYSLADWNVRTWLYRSQRGEMGRLPEGCRNIIDIDSDPYGKAVLGPLGVTPYQGDLRDMHHVIKTQLESADFAPSDLVMRILRMVPPR